MVKLITSEAQKISRKGNQRIRKEDKMITLTSGLNVITSQKPIHSVKQNVKRNDDYRQPKHRINHIYLDGKVVKMSVGRRAVSIMRDITNREPDLIVRNDYWHLVNHNSLGKVVIHSYYACNAKSSLLSFDIYKIEYYF